MVNKNPETDIGVQAEGQKSKTASHWLLPIPQSKMVTLPLGILRMRLSESCLLLFYILSLGLKVCTTIT